MSIELCTMSIELITMSIEHFVEEKLCLLYTWDQQSYKWSGACTRFVWPLTFDVVDIFSLI